MTRELPINKVNNSSQDFTLWPARPENAVADLVVVISHNGKNKLHIMMHGPEIDRRFPGEHYADLKIRASETRSLASWLRSEWDTLVWQQDTSGVRSFPFADNIDLRKRPDVLSEVASLSGHGAHVLNRLLRGKDAALISFGITLRKILQGEGLRIRFHSAIYVPWSMLALHSSVSDDPFKRFLGYRHQIEQTQGTYQQLRRCDHAELNSSLNRDDIDPLLVRPQAVEKLRNLMLRASTLSERSRRSRLLDDLKNPIFDEDLMYFWCHGVFVPADAEPPRFAIQLSDRPGYIDAHLIDEGRSEAERIALRDGTKPLFHPFVMINACGAGQVAASVELIHLGKAMIEKGAHGVLGPQIRMPVEFASAYALHFLSRYLKDGSSAGYIVYQLGREYANVYRNPLGLAYSLHCGLDSHINPHRPKGNGL